jgi:selenocysteine-specific elongation factor
MYTIATAGHIDHGKSSLVKALTGTDPDRLPEEKEREMTIELGFASFQLSTGEEVGIVDVPGHERFIKNMISGVGALDMVMFVVAADDGWMPQSEEHLAILRYLGVERGMIVLTKVDMVDPDWKEMVKSDLRTKTVGTFLDGCEIVEFSAQDYRNLDIVKGTVERILKSVQREAPSDSARLYVDRVFTIAGTGTVVTGTLREGTFTVGQEVFHHPSKQKTKIKNLESFYSHLDKALPGVRLAVGLQSLERGAVSRGDLIYPSQHLQPSSILGIKLIVEPKQANFIKHNREIVFLQGTSEVEGKFFLPPEPVVCDDGALIAILRLDEPVIVKTGDRFILRLPTPSVMVGGGIVVDPILEIFRRTAENRWESLRGASTLTVRAMVDYALATKSIVAKSELLVQSLLPQSQIDGCVAQLLEEGTVIKRDRYLILKSVWSDASDQLVSEVKQFHQQNQHLASMSLAALTGKVSLPEQLFDYVLEGLLSAGVLERQDAGIKVREYSAGLSPALEKAKSRVLAMLLENDPQSISREEILAADKDGKKIFAYLKQNNEILDLGGMVYLIKTFDRLTAEIVEHLKKHEKMTVAEARDVTGTSRRFILPLLEELDRRRITKREGDYRMLYEQNK